jgi:hypothetical protein
MLSQPPVSIKLAVMRRFFTELFQPCLSVARIACAMIRDLLTPNRAISVYVVLQEGNEHTCTRSMKGIKQ